jgi:hypothetical protein
MVFSFDEVCSRTRTLEMVFQWPDIPSIKACHLVNKTWEEDARAVLLERCDVPLLSSTDGSVRINHPMPSVLASTGWLAGFTTEQVVGLDVEKVYTT